MRDLSLEGWVKSLEQTNRSRSRSSSAEVATNPGWDVGRHQMLVRRRREYWTQLLLAAVCMCGFGGVYSACINPFTMYAQNLLQVDGTHGTAQHWGGLLPSNKVLCLGSEQRGNSLILRGGSMRSTAAPSSKHRDFTRVDQDELNRYAGLNHKCKDLTTDLQELQDWRDSIRDAVAEIDMMDPKAPDFKVKWASVYSNWPPEQAKLLLENRMHICANQMDEVRLDISEMREQMDVLRQKLKSKFGDAVHLEDESEEEGVDEVNH